MRTLLIEPEDQDADAIVSALRHQGYTVDRVCDDGGARLALSTIRYGLVLLNMALPNASGFSLLIWLRRLNGKVPLMTLGRDETAADRVNVLDAGADDHLNKPFDTREMSARCRALVRRSQGRTVEQVQYRELFVDPPTKVVSLGGRPVDTSPREWAVLLQLITNLGVPQSMVSATSFL